MATLAALVKISLREMFPNSLGFNVRALITNILGVVCLQPLSDSPHVATCSVFTRWMLAWRDQSLATQNVLL